MKTECLFCNKNIQVESIFNEAMYVLTDLSAITSKCPICGKTFEAHLFKAGVVCSKLGEPPVLSNEKLVAIPSITSCKKKDNYGVIYTLKNEVGEVIFSGPVPFYKPNYKVTSIYTPAKASKPSVKEVILENVSLLIDHVLNALKELSSTQVRVIAICLFFCDDWSFDAISSS